jgi:hypothetical protein
VLSWTLTLAPIFGPALLVFAVYALARWGVWDTKARPCTDDARPYDPRRLRR